MLASTLPFVETAEIIHDRSTEIIYLNFNENPYESFTSIIAALQDAINEASCYPDLIIEEFLTKLSAYHSISSDQILFSNGLSALLMTASEIFLGVDKKLVMPPNYY